MSGNDAVRRSLLEQLGVSMDVFQAIRNRNCVEMDSYEKRTFSELQEQSETVQGVSNKHSEPFPTLVEDIFGIYHNGFPKVNDTKEVDPAFRFNKAFVEKVLENPETQQTRLYSRYDPTLSAVATVQTARQLLTEIEQNEKLSEAMDAASKAEQEQLKGNSKKAEQLAKHAESILNDNPASMRVATQRAIDAGKEAAKDTAEAMAGWGLEPGDLAKMNPQERINAVRRLREPDIKKISELVGRMKNLARAKQRAKLTQNPTQLHKTGIGTNIERMLPAEYIFAGTPVLQPQFYRKWANRELQQYELNTKEKQARGPMIFLGDTSGSMNGQPIQWCIAVAMALVDTAYRQKRKSSVGFFNGTLHSVFDFSKTQKDVSQLIEMASIGASGGTDFVPPLKFALEKIQEEGFKKADIVFATDGVCVLHQDFLEKFKALKREYNFQVFTVLLGATDKDNQLMEWSDKVWQVQALDDETAADIFELVY